MRAGPSAERLLNFRIVKVGNRKMFNLKVRLIAVPLKIRSLEIYVLNAILSFLIMQKRLRTSKLVLLMDSRLAQLRERMNREAESFIKNYFLVTES